jgi:hypothetical protein
MADINALIHNLRFWVGDIEMPFSNTPEELEMYLVTAGRKMGLDDDYADWSEFPTKFESVVVKLAYLNYLLQEVASSATTSGIRIEDLEISTGTTDDATKLIRTLRRDIEDDLNDLGIGMPSAVLSTVSRYDRESHAYVPYELQTAPTAPTLTGSVSSTTVSLSWTSYTDKDFGHYKIERSTDQVTWTSIRTYSDNHTTEHDDEDMSVGTYYYRVTTVLNNSLEGVSGVVTAVVT